jgi:hypothetical protein
MLPGFDMKLECLAARIATYPFWNRREQLVEWEPF